MSDALVAVLHTAQIGGKSVRLFRSPLEGPDFPWHSVDDLHLALGFPRDLRRELKTKLQREWREEVRTIATSGGITTIAPHPMAQGLIAAADDVGCAPYTAGDDYARAGAKALGMITAGMPPAALVAYSVAAFHRGGGL